MNINTYIKFYFINLLNVGILFLINFVFKFIQPNYFICNNIKDYRFFSMDISYPISCDQESYYSAIRDLQTLFSEGYVYQGRPLFILINNFISNFIDLVTFSLIEDFDVVIHLSVVFLNIFVITLSSIMFLKAFEIDLSNNFFLYFLISFVLCASPLNKWGIFDPSNQLWTLLIITLNSYLLTKKKEHINYKISLLIGLLVLVHRIFIVGYALVFLILLIEKVFKLNLKDFTYILRMLIIALLPFVFYNLYIFIFQDQLPYDENSSHYGQFIWLPLYLLTSKRYEGGWHCMEIPDFLGCYLVDNMELFIYLIIPLVFVLISKPVRLFKENIAYENLLKFTFLIYLFYSLIGWYPPIRFSYYSLGNLLILLNVFLLIQNKSKLNQLLHFTSISIFMISLNHWNYDEIIDLNFGIVFSFVILGIYLVNNLFRKIRKA